MKKYFVLLIVALVLIFSSLFYYYKVNYLDRTIEKEANKKNENISKESEKNDKELHLKSIDNQKKYIKNNKYYGYLINNKSSARKLKPEKGVDVNDLVDYDTWLNLYNNKEWKDSGSFDITLGKNELLRNNNGFVYSIVKPADNQGYVFYVYNKGFVVAEIHIIKIPSKELMEKNLEKGKKIIDLAKIDKTILETNSNFSRHRFYDGTMVYIESDFDKDDNRGKIIDWFYTEDSLHLIQKILKKDLKLIK